MFFVVSYKNYHSLAGSVATGMMIFGIVFTLTILFMTICMKLYQKRVTDLEKDYEDDEA
ncbi:MAG: hypothetical protein PUB10_04345 [Clostridiales bacterium]|nr:hypothetical protein [Clostridiales bacterium]